MLAPAQPEMRLKRALISEAVTTVCLARQAELVNTLATSNRQAVYTPSSCSQSRSNGRRGNLSTVARCLHKSVDGSGAGTGVPRATDYNQSPSTLTTLRHVYCLTAPE